MIAFLNACGGIKGHRITALEKTSQNQAYTLSN
jgi:hypothetical protein